MSTPKMSVEKHAVRLAGVYERAYPAAEAGLPKSWDIDEVRRAAHAIAVLLVQQALNEGQ